MIIPAQMQELTNIRLDFFRQEIKQGKNIWVRINGHSMWPFLHDGQAIRVSPVDIEKVSVGDIILVYINGNLVCHRVFRKHGSLLQTKADASCELDPLVGEHELIGKVTAKNKKGRTLNLNGPIYSFFGSCISRITLIAARYYPILASLKKLLKGNLTKMSLSRGMNGPK